MGWIKRWVMNIGLVLISIVIAALLAEIVLRFTEYRLLMIPKKNTIPFNMFKEDKDAGYDIKENNKVDTAVVEGIKFPVWSNELGCFDKPYNAEKDYILLVGDSFTWGLVTHEDKLGTVIEERLNRRVLKCGVGGYGTRQELLKTKKLLGQIDSKSSVIIVGYGILNDLRDDYLFPNATVIKGYLVSKTVFSDNKQDFTDTRTGEKLVFSDSELESRLDKKLKEIQNEKPVHPIKKWLRSYSLIYNLLKEIKLLGLMGQKLGILHEQVMPSRSSPPLYIRMPQKYLWLDTAWSDHLNNIKEFKQLADRIGSKLLIVIIPSKEQVYEFLKPNYEEGVDWNFSNKMLNSLCSRENIDCLDLLSDFKQYSNQSPKKFLNPYKDLYYRYDVHWNINGNRLAGLLVSKYIIEKGFVDVGNKEDKLFEIEMGLRTFREER